MKTELEVTAFQEEQSKKMLDCKKCNGAIDKDCSCTRLFKFRVAAYEACIPRDFWNVKPDAITHNKLAFQNFVKPYAERLHVAHRRGYGLCFSGSNGVGKSMFMSYVLTRAIKAGRTAYYTTMLQLDHDIKAGFNDRDRAERLEWMLTSDFLAIDEMGKEQFKALGQSTYTKSQLERIFKKRFDDSQAMMIGTNLSVIGLGKGYGDTIMSMVKGKMQNVNMLPGDVRIANSSRMRRDMGFARASGADDE